MHHLLILINISQGLSEAGLSLPWLWQLWLSLGSVPPALPCPVLIPIYTPLYFVPFPLTARKSHKHTQYSAVEIIPFYVSLADNHKAKTNHWSLHNSGLALSR